MKRILVCEDEDAIRDYVVINLKRSGYDVIDVSNAAQAMDAYVHYGGLIDVALLDIMMPGMDGSELCRWLMQKSDTMGIIMLSAKSQEVDKI
ncbi:response regulator, partial [[Eubacterium] siraeum]|nr:response regulator [[Eubacterium] siraeum]